MTLPVFWLLLHNKSFTSSLLETRLLKWHSREQTRACEQFCIMLWMGIGWPIRTLLLTVLWPNQFYYLVEYTESCSPTVHNLFECRICTLFMVNNFLKERLIKGIVNTLKVYFHVMLWFLFSHFILLLNSVLSFIICLIFLQIFIAFAWSNVSSFFVILFSLQCFTRNWLPVFLPFLSEGCNSFDSDCDQSDELVIHKSVCLCV